MTDELQRNLQAYLAQAWPDRPAARVGPFTSLTTGWESELYAFALEDGPAGAGRREDLVLRLYSGEDAPAKAAHEFESMRRLHQAGYPVPRVDLLERGRAPFGRPFVVMERIDGQTLWSLIEGTPAERRPALDTLFCGLFVRLHQMDWRPFADDEARARAASPYGFVDGWLAMARDLLRQFPAIDLLPVVEWLARRRDELPCARPSPVHQDFHHDNVMIRADGSPVVIDWTGFDVTDARFDLAWTLILAYAYEGAEMRAATLREYERLAGAPVAHIDCFEVFACARRIFDISVSLGEGAERLGMRAEAVAMIRRDMGPHRRVYELLVERTGIRLAAIEELLRA